MMYSQVRTYWQTCIAIYDKTVDCRPSTVDKERHSPNLGISRTFAVHTPYIVHVYLARFPSLGRLSPRKSIYKLDI
jgi:hypothetical protein